MLSAPNRGFSRVARHTRTASYWLGDAFEMAAIKTILIIVNSNGL
jgi:hypothetical protein